MNGDALHSSSDSKSKAMANKNDNDNDSDRSAVRCPCGEPDYIDITREEPTDAWVRCDGDGCKIWQHSICVGLIENEKTMPKKYYCEECRPGCHQRFQCDPDKIIAVVKERQDMHTEVPNQKEETKWLVTEIMAIAKAHSKRVDAAFAAASNVVPDVIPEDWDMPDLEKNMTLSIRTVLYTANITALKDFRAKLLKVWFDDWSVAIQMWDLHEWLDDNFMARMESVQGREWIKEMFEMEGLDGVEQANAELVKEYFKLK